MPQDWTVSDKPPVAPAQSGWSVSDKPPDRSVADLYSGIHQETSIAPREDNPVANWFGDVVNDVRHGTDVTFPGRALKALGAPGTESGAGGGPGGVGELMGGELIGPARVASQGFSTVAPKNHQAAFHKVNEMTEGAFQSPGPAAALIPGAVPGMAIAGTAGGLASAGASKLGAGPETSELIGNAASLATPFAEKVGDVIRSNAPGIGKAAGYGTAAYRTAKTGNPVELLYGSPLVTKPVEALTDVIGSGVQKAGGVTKQLIDLGEFTPTGHSDVQPTPFQATYRFARNTMGMKGAPVPQAGIGPERQLPQGLIELPQGEAVQPSNTPRVQVERGKGGRMTRVYPPATVEPGTGTIMNPGQVEHPWITGTAPAQAPLINTPGESSEPKGEVLPPAQDEQNLVKDGFLEAPKNVTQPLTNESESPIINQEEKQPEEAKPLVDTGEKPVDRRVDTDRRKLINDMSPDEVKKELLTSSKTGLPNERAFNELNGQVPAQAVGMSDADGLKAFNDRFGYEAGDALLKAKADALQEAGVDAYHKSGDEFLYRGKSPDTLKEDLERAREIFRNTPIEVTMNDGTVKQFKGADFSYGTGTSTAEAEGGLKTHKAEREQAGQRARGELRGITEIGPEGDQVSEGAPEEENGVAQHGSVEGDFSTLGPQDFYHGSQSKNLINTGIRSGESEGLKDSMADSMIPEGLFKPEDYRGVYLSSHQDDALMYGDVNRVTLPSGSKMRLDPLEGTPSGDALIHMGDIPSGKVSTPEDVLSEKGLQQDFRQDLDRGEQASNDLMMKKFYKNNKVDVSKKTGQRYNPEIPGGDNDTILPWAQTPWADLNKPPVDEYEPQEGASASMKIKPNTQNFFNPFSGDHEPEPKFSADELNDLYRGDVLDTMAKTHGEMIHIPGEEKWNPKGFTSNTDSRIIAKEQKMVDSAKHFLLNAGIDADMMSESDLDPTEPVDIIEAAKELEWDPDTDYLKPGAIVNMDATTGDYAADDLNMPKGDSPTGMEKVDALIHKQNPELFDKDSSDNSPDDYLFDENGKVVGDAEEGIYDRANKTGDVYTYDELREHLDDSSFDNQLEVEKRAFKFLNEQHNFDKSELVNMNPDKLMRIAKAHGFEGGQPQNAKDIVNKQNDMGIPYDYKKDPSYPKTGDYDLDAEEALKWMEDNDIKNEIIANSGTDNIINIARKNGWPGPEPLQEPDQEFTKNVGDFYEEAKNFNDKYGYPSTVPNQEPKPLIDMKEDPNMENPRRKMNRDLIDTRGVAQEMRERAERDKRPPYK